MNTTKSILNITIYTDGSSKPLGNIRFGGWAFCVTENEGIKYSASGGEVDTTNQRMELQAAIEACEYISQRRKQDQPVTIYSDSAYLVNCYLQNWWRNWIKNGWVNSKGEDVANKDLWWQLIPFFQNKNYTFRKVKGHADNYFNELCDRDAQREADNLRRNWRGRKTYEEQREFFS